ncbi:hypothetical protein ACLI4U_00305 [Natrialbaceae archaeon A-CW2]|uniref:DUF7310 family coiled-coil domain-containing protein n=1 Tax=Natronosalvus amylolyticus TaxID=2961994 RepID=UPI0020C93D23|nr:hypothetical protein [Natronosalvus amylolyticus]
MSDIDRIEHRLAAVERVVVDDERTFDDIAHLAALSDAVERLEERLEDHERRIAEIDGKNQSVEGYVNNVERINENVEQQANVALATVDRLEKRVDELAAHLETDHGQSNRAFTPEAETDDTPAPLEESHGADAEADSSVRVDGHGQGVELEGEAAVEQAVDEIFETATDSRAPETPTGDDAVVEPASPTTKPKPEADQYAVDTQLAGDVSVNEVNDQDDGGPAADDSSVFKRVLSKLS